MGELVLKGLGLICATVVSCVILCKNPMDEEVAVGVGIFEIIAILAIFVPWEKVIQQF